MLLSWHNLAFYQELMAAMRAAIEVGKFEDFRTDFYEIQKAGDLPPL
jgi:queuine tRNA-ribosyltransferase